MSLENDVVAGLQNPNIPMASLVSATMNTFSPEAIERIVQKVIKVIGSSLSGYRRGFALATPYLNRSFVYLNLLLPKISLHLSKLTYSLHTLCKAFLRLQHPKLGEVHAVCEKIDARLDGLIFNPNTCSLKLANLLSGISSAESESPDFVSHYLATLILGADLALFRATQKIEADSSGPEEAERRVVAARDTIFAPVAEKLGCFLYGLYVKLAVNSQLDSLATLLAVIRKEIVVRPEIVGAKISYPEELVDVICLTTLRFFCFVSDHVAFWEASDEAYEGGYDSVSGDTAGDAAAAEAEAGDPGSPGNPAAAAERPGAAAWEATAASLLRAFPREFLIREVCLRKLAERNAERRAVVRIAVAAAAGGEGRRAGELLSAVAGFGG